MTSRALDPARRAEILQPPDPNDGPVDVVIDTDAGNEIDDQFALVWAFLRPDRVRIEAVTACPFGYDAALQLAGAGTADLDKAAYAARVGAAPDPLVGGFPALGPADGVARARAEIVRVLDVLGEPVGDRVPLGADRYLPGPDEPVDSDAAQLIIDLGRRERARPLQVLAIGCATNIASALLLAPDLASRIVVVWTSAYPSFWPYPNVSYNLVQDLHAARVLFESGVPLVYLPGYYVGEELRVSRADVDAHVGGQGPVGDYLAGLFRAWVDASRGPGPTTVLWDLINVAWVVDPSWLATGLVTTPSLGDDRRWAKHGPDRHLMREATDVNRDAVISDLFACLARRATSA